MEKNKISSLILTALIMTSCSAPHYFYSANNHNVPLFKDKCEFTGKVAVSRGIQNTSLEIQAAYSLPGHIALMANCMTGGKINGINKTPDYSKCQYYEGGLGYYKAVDSIFVFEVYGGYGIGTQNHIYGSSPSFGHTYGSYPDGDAQLAFSKIFLQPNLGLRKGKIEAAISARLSSVEFNKVNFQNVSESNDLTLIKQFPTTLLIEPAVTFRAGGKYVKGEIQAGFSENLDNLNRRFETFRVSGGVRIYFAKKMVEK
jgi:hypothetical protein